MDSIKFEKLISENMKAIFGFSLTRLGDVNEAEYLTSDILYNLIRSVNNLKEEDRFYGFMWKIAENTYKEYLRKKFKKTNQILELDENIADDSDSALAEIIKKEDLNLLRRELSLLSKQYRDTTVLYYIENFFCTEVAEKLKISTEMVKYYLFRARKIIREGMSMERLYGEKSYRPNVFEIDFWGSKGGDSREYEDFRKRKIKGNILLAAYYCPVTIQEISIELGVSLPYLEDEIKLLLERKYLVCKNGKYLTNIPIFTIDCTKTIEERLKELTCECAEKFISQIDEFSESFGNRFDNENLMRWQKVLMCLHFSLINSQDNLDKNYGKLPSDGPYSLVNGGGGHGIIWGRNKETIPNNDNSLEGIQGIYNGCPSTDKRGSVIAMNFIQTLNAQEFQGNMTDPVVATAVDCYDYLPDAWKNYIEEKGYAKNGKSNFTVWTNDEFNKLSKILKN